MDGRRKPEGIPMHADAEPKENVKKQREELLKFLDVPLRLQDAGMKSRDKKHAKRDAEVKAGRVRGFAEHMNAISGLKEGKKVGRIPATLAGLLGLHTLDHPRLFELRGQDPYVYMSSSDATSATDNKSVIVRHDSEKGFSVELSEREFRSAYNRLPSADLEGVTKWIASLFPSVDFEVSASEHRPGGMSVAGGGPAEFQTRRLSGSPENIEQAFEMYQAFVLIRGVSRSLKREVGRRTEKVLNADWKRDRAYKVDEEAYLSDLIEEKTLEAITLFLSNEGSSFMGKVLDVNMVIRESSGTPTISFRDVDVIFGQSVSRVRTIELPPVDLGIQIPELRIEEFDLAKVSRYGRESGEKMRVNLPPDAQVDIAVPYYPAFDERALENSAKKSLFEVLGKWFAKNPRKEGARVDEAGSMVKLEVHLKELGLSLEELRDLSVDEQVTRVKKAYRALARKYHPDINPDDPGAEKRLVKLNAASEFLLKKYGIALID